MPGRNIFFHK